MKKLLLVFSILFFSLALKAQYIRSFTDDGTSYLLGTNKIVSATTEGSQTILLYGQSLTKYYADEPLADVVTNSCGKFFMITDVAIGKQRAINKDYVERIYEAPGGEATIVIRDLDLGNPLKTISTVEPYSAFDPGILNCEDPIDGAQVLSRVDNTLILSGGGGSVDVSDLLDNTDNQVITQFSFNSGTGNLTITLQNSGTYVANLNNLQDDWGNQTVVSDGVTVSGTGIAGDSIKNISNLYITDGTDTEAIGPNDTLVVTTQGIVIADVTPIKTLDISLDLSGANAGQVLVFDGDSLVWQDILANETITTITSTDSTFTYINEANDTVIVNFLSDETITTIIDNGNGTATYTNENGTQVTFTTGIGALQANNAISMDLDTVQFGGPLIKNTIVNHDAFTLDFNGAPRFKVTNDTNGDAMEVSSGFGARLTGNAQNEIQLNASSFIVDGGLGKTYWKYGGTPVSTGSFLHVINSATKEVYYAPYSTPLNNIGAADYILKTNNSGNLIWSPLSDIGAEETITTLTDNNNGSFTYTNEAGADTTWSETVTTLVNNLDGTFTYTSEDGTVTDIEVDVVGDNWGNDSFTITGDTGPQQTVLASDNVEITGENLLEVETEAGDGVIVRIDPTGASTDDVITFNGTSVIWGPGGGTDETVTTLVDNGNASFTYTNEDGIQVTYFETLSTLVPTGNPNEFLYTNEIGVTTTITSGGADNWGSGSFTVSADSGPAQTISESDNLIIQGNNLLRTLASATDNVTVEIDDTGAVVNDVITFDGTNVVWAPGSSGADDWGTGNFIAAAETGPNQTISQGNTLSFTGSNLLATQASATDIIDVFISTTGASTNDVITFNGTNVVWGPGAGNDDWGTGNFIVSGESGPNQTIDEGNILNITGSELITTVASNTDNLDVKIDGTGATSGQVITWNGTNVVWDNAPSGADNWGAGNFTVSAETGPNQTIDQGNTLNFTGSNLIETVASATDNVDTRISTTGATSGQVIQFNGTNVVWGNAPETITTFVANANKTYTYTSENGTVTTTQHPILTSDCTAFTLTRDASGNINFDVNYPDCATASVDCPCYEVCGTGEKILIVKQ